MMGGYLNGVEAQCRRNFLNIAYMNCHMYIRFRGNFVEAISSLHFYVGYGDDLIFNLNIHVIFPKMYNTPNPQVLPPPILMFLSFSFPLLKIY